MQFAIDTTEQQGVHVGRPKIGTEYGPACPPHFAEIGHI